MRRHILSVLSVAVSVAVAGWSGVPNPPRAAQAVQRAAEPSAPPTTALVVGRVIDATTGHPIESAVVSVRTRSGLQTDQVRSNANGNFVLRDVPPGTWYVNATRYGHEMYPPGSRVIAVTPVDRVVEVRVRMAKQAVIGGLVTDEAGEPVVGATVRLHSWGPTGFWHPSLSAITDDRGRYRIWTVRPGPQLVSVQPSYASAPAAMLDARDGSDARVAAAARQGLTAAGLSTVARESPGAVEVSGLVVVASGIGASAVTFADGQAQAFRNEFYRAGAVVTLAAGDVADTVDMQLVRVPAGRVSGRVEGDPERIGQLPVQLVNADEPPGLRLRQPIVVARTMTLTDGGFTFPVVPAGRYTLKILKRPAAPSAQIPPQPWRPAPAPSMWDRQPRPPQDEEPCRRAPRSGPAFHLRWAAKAWLIWWSRFARAHT
jgi:hypothetical protein